MKLIKTLKAVYYTVGIIGIITAIPFYIVLYRTAFTQKKG
jgi:hypothetical protein